MQQGFLNLSASFTGRNSGGRPVYAGRGISPGRDAGLSDPSFSYGRGSSSSGHASPQVWRSLLMACTCHRSGWTVPLP